MPQRPTSVPARPHPNPSPEGEGLRKVFFPLSFRRGGQGVRSLRHFALAGAVLLGVALAAAQPPESPSAVALQRQRTPIAKADELSRGCLSCHLGVEPIHPTRTVQIGCTECHGGDATAARPEGSDAGSP